MTTPTPKTDYRTSTLTTPVRGTTSTATPAQIAALKQHVVNASAHVASVKKGIVASQAALAALDPATVNAVAVPGYPPPSS